MTEQLRTIDELTPQELEAAYDEACTEAALFPVPHPGPLVEFINKCRAADVRFDADGLFAEEA